jgi:crotonobetainyl-CoA:carnitine CoA-transferase CaiB-like acyl-CoA transferase
MCDASNALLSIVGVLMALFHRQRTGEGQELWTSLLDGGVIFSSDVFLTGGKSWDRPRLDRDLTGLSALYRLYRTQDDDWIMIAAVKDAEWEALCRTLHLEHLLTEERFATATSRHEHRRQLATLLEPVFRTKTARYWSRTLDDAEVPNEIPIDTWDGEQVLYDADNERLGLVAEYVHPIVGVMRQFGDLVRFSETPGHIGGPPPLVGQDTREILRELGYRDGEIDALAASNVVYVADDAYLTRFTN